MTRTISGRTGALLIGLACALAPGVRAGEAAAPVRIVVGDCVLEAPSEEHKRLEDLAQRAATLLPRVEAELGTRAASSYRIVLIPPGPSVDPEVRVLDSLAPPWAAGFLIPGRRAGGIRIATADRYPYADLGSVLAHEATHMLLYDAAGAGLPRWFGEGVATGVERSWGMRDILVHSSSVLTGRLPPLAELDEAFDASDDRAPAAYAASFDFLLFSLHSYGPDVVREIVRQARTHPFPEAWREATGQTLERSETDWRRGSLLLYRWIPALTGTTALWIGITFLALVAGARRRARSRRILDQWEIEERGRRLPVQAETGPRPVPPPDPPDEVVH